MAQLKAGVAKLADQTSEVMRLAQASYPPAMAFIDKFAQVGKALQEMIEEAMKNRQGPEVGKSPTPQPAEGIPPGMGA